MTSVSVQNKEIMQERTYNLTILSSESATLYNIAYVF